MLGAIDVRSQIGVSSLCLDDLDFQRILFWFSRTLTVFVFDQVFASIVNPDPFSATILNSFHCRGDVALVKSSWCNPSKTNRAR
jgi:hypothetical protein